ncbi:hypothetical protein LshimejAT787_0200230 [Lyophyllum shimeji]|uniref:Uncharacterized protein n=1 Tax=Lyophyllum shimeji TaxID=47721 RepID=A0A9P3PFG3_LYOSH|nr:hypothetical protein LshimejAT787_0200230 [Lyophyllum shimeji]
MRRRDLKALVLRHTFPFIDLTLPNRSRGMHDSDFGIYDHSIEVCLYLVMKLLGTVRRTTHRMPRRWRVTNVYPSRELSVDNPGHADPGATLKSFMKNP